MRIFKTSKFVRKYKKLILFGIILLALLFLTSKSSGRLDYYSENNNYFYGNLSFINGINISRWYGQLKKINPVVTRLLFNKLLYPPIIVAKYSTILFQGLVNFLFL